MKTWLAVLDRTAVLFLGLAAGAAIAWSFTSQRETAPARIIMPPTMIVPPPAIAPPVKSGKRHAPVKTGTVGTGPIACPECAQPVDQRLLASLTTDRPVRVGVFGDSFGDGVWSGLNRLLRQPQFEVDKFSQQATGFTRYRSLNLEDHTREQVAGKPVQIAVITFGANDEQGVFANGHYAALLSPAWQEEIGARVERLVGLLRAQGAMVYWVGLPRMRKASYDADVQNMNAFYAARMASLRVPWIDVRPISSGDDGGYAPYLPGADGKPMLMRADDGIHMSMNGYLRITKGLAARIRTYVDTVKKLSGAKPHETEKAA